MHEEQEHPFFDSLSWESQSQSLGRNPYSPQAIRYYTLSLPHSFLYSIWSQSNLICKNLRKPNAIKERTYSNKSVVQTCDKSKFHSMRDDTCLHLPLTLILFRIFNDEKENVRKNSISWLDSYITRRRSLPERERDQRRNVCHTESSEENARRISFSTQWSWCSWCVMIHQPPNERKRENEGAGKSKGGLREKRREGKMRQEARSQETCSETSKTRKGGRERERKETRRGTQGRRGRERRRRRRNQGVKELDRHTHIHSTTTTRITTKRKRERETDRQRHYMKYTMREREGRERAEWKCEQILLYYWLQQPQNQEDSLCLC